MHSLTLSAVSSRTYRYCLLLHAHLGHCLRCQAELTDTVFCRIHTLDTVCGVMHSFVLVLFCTLWTLSVLSCTLWTLTIRCQTQWHWWVIFDLEYQIVFGNQGVGSILENSWSKNVYKFPHINCCYSCVDCKDCMRKRYSIYIQNFHNFIVFHLLNNWNIINLKQFKCILKSLGKHTKSW